jgi:4-hydroxy-tetrahydrodipicolinate reductase
VKLAVFGAAGRMGRTILACIEQSPEFELAGAVVEAADPDLGRDSGAAAGLPETGILLTDDRPLAVQGAQVAIDFTLPAALDANLEACRDAGTPVVIGTTGLSGRQQQLIRTAAHEIPIVYGRNMSVGMNVFMHFVAQAAKTLGEEFDVEIFEAHHRHKVDAPSGTALALGEAVAAARDRRLDEVAVRTRDGQTGPRVPGTIGFSVVRGGSIVGDHTVMFIAPEERLEFTHRAMDRRAFAVGALRAAHWLAGRAPGLYSMQDVLELD